MTNCTPGEWQVSYRPAEDMPDAQRTRDQWGYAEVIVGEESILRADRGDPEDIANIKMAAASKDMYDALRDLESMAAIAMEEANRDGAEYDIGAELADARAAMAKARGES